MRFLVTALVLATLVLVGCSRDTQLNESPQQVASEQAAANAHNAGTIPFAGDDETPSTDVPLVTTSTEVSYDGVAESRVGDCLDLPTFKTASVRRVPCDSPHHYEVTAKVDLRPRFPTSAAIPDDWRPITVSECRPAFEGYVRQPPPPGIEDGSLHPASQTWYSGDRILTCVVEPAGNKEGNVLTGSVRRVG